MPKDNVNIEKHIKTYVLNTCVITENAKLRKNLKKIKRHKHLRQLITRTPITYNYNQANEYFQRNFYDNPFGYACDICDTLWYINDLKQVKEKRINILALDFPVMDVAPLKACVTCTATLDRRS
jgi:hypothetical protein